jgi:hypothetical protein
VHLLASVVEVHLSPCSGNDEAVISTALQQASYIEPQDNEVCRLSVAGQLEASARHKLEYKTVGGAELSAVAWLWS